jgi:hypothetical protein
METRNIKITLDKARKWYNSGNTSLKEVALQAFSKDELVFNFKNITSFEKACNALNLNYDIISIVVKDIATYSRASAAMFKLNIIRKALNRDYNLHLTKDVDGKGHAWYPYFRFITKGSTHYRIDLRRGICEKLGKITSEGITYDVLGGDALNSAAPGLGYFLPHYSVGSASIYVGFLGCATKEIAKHFGKFFGILVMEAMYSDVVDFKVIERKYN